MRARTTKGRDFFQPYSVDITTKNTETAPPVHIETATANYRSRTNLFFMKLAKIYTHVDVSRQSSSISVEATASFSMMRNTKKKKSTGGRFFSKIGTIKTTSS